MQWETVIGLEVHVQLNTLTKIFSGSSTAFGAAPNSQANAVDLALPGTLPVVNEQAIHHAIRFGLAIDAEIAKETIFERKNYFYPDLPKGYQTSQMAAPIVGAGHLEIELKDGSTKKIRIHHAHLEEDAGKSLHEDFHGQTGIDLNRAGTPLIEIVTEPDMNSIEEAVGFAKKLHNLVTSIGITDGEMSQGSMRFDVNISVRPYGQTELGTRTETKNLNSFKFMEDAIALEVERQIDVIESGKEVLQQTRLYNGQTGVAKAMRSKEEANDYRYFPCPDILPIVIPEILVQDIKASMPELPEQKRQRLIKDFGLSEYDATLISGDSQASLFFEQSLAITKEAKLVANWLLGDLAAWQNQQDQTLNQCPVTPKKLATLINKIKDNTLSNKMAKQVFEIILKEGGEVEDIIEQKGLKQESDSGALEALIDDIIKNNPKQVEQYLNAEPAKQKKLLGFFVGQMMKVTQGKANPAIINQLLLTKLK